MQDNGYLYILDYESTVVYECELDEKDDGLEASDILKRRGFKESNVNYMFSEDKLDFNFVPAPKD